MTLLETLRALAPVVTPGEWAYTRNPENTRWIIDSEPARSVACTAGYEPDNEANARIIVTLRNAIPAIIAALEVVDLVRDEDWLAERISDSLDVDWRPLDAARAIIAALPNKPVDPLVEAVRDCGYATLDAIEPEFVADLRAALAKRGLKLVEVGDEL